MKASKPPIRDGFKPDRTAAKRSLKVRRRESLSRWQCFGVRGCTELKQPGSCRYFRYPAAKADGCGFFRQLRQPEDVNELPSCYAERRAVEAIRNDLVRLGVSPASALQIAALRLESSRNGSTRASEVAAKLANNLEIEILRRREAETSPRSNLDQIRELLRTLKPQGILDAPDQPQIDADAETRLDAHVESGPARTQTTSSDEETDDDLLD